MTILLDRGMHANAQMMPNVLVELVVVCGMLQARDIVGAPGLDDFLSAS